MKGLAPAGFLMLLLCVANDGRHAPVPQIGKALKAAVRTEPPPVDRMMPALA